MRKIPQILLLLLMSHLACHGQIFIGGKSFVYNIQYFHSEQNITTNELIILTITGKNWKYSQDQKEAIWNYATNRKVKNQFKDKFSIGWFSSDTTGIIENDKKIWIHPPRHNQYSMNEIAPFPDFRKQLRVGDTYSSIISIGNGFGPWAGEKVKFIYNITKVDQEQSDTTWTINATAEIEGKINTLNFIFSEKRGFVYMDYSFFNGDREIFKLKE